LLRVVFLETDRRDQYLEAERGSRASIPEKENQGRSCSETCIQFDSQSLGLWGIRGRSPVGGLADIKEKWLGDSSVKVSRNLKVGSGKIIPTVDSINFSSKSV
jgi:hypothetical protein